MKERLREIIAISTAVTLSLGGTACGGADPSPKQQPKAPENSEIKIKKEVFANGQRIISFNNTFASYSYSPILQFCDGNDLVEISSGYYTDDLNSIERSVRHPACTDDGTLTESDFE